MNYRHAFHAGNFADCMKHAVLVWLLRALQRKPAPLFVLDTHAGIDHYDLENGPAMRTGEWRNGIARLLDEPPSPLAQYVALVRSIGLYPGSPALISALLRSDDRLACCELHSDDIMELRRHFGHDRQVAVHHRDAWEALRALLPPRERRGLILIDPPFEDRQEFVELANGLVAGHTRFRTGVFAAWYPIKHRTPVRDFHMRMQASGVRDMVAVELLLRKPLDPARLNGCGMLLINPPYGFQQELPSMFDALLRRLGNDETDGSTAIIRIAEE